MDKTITTDQALKILGCNAKTLQRKKKDGLVQSWKIGRDWYFYEHEILSLLPDVKKKQSKYRPDAVDKQIKKQEAAEQKIKEIEQKKEDSKSKPPEASLNEYGLRMLSELTKELNNIGVFKEVDRPLLFAASLAYQTYIAYETLSISLDYTDMNAKGEYKEHHYSNVARKHLNTYITITEKLGLTPTSRVKFKLPEPEDIDEMEALLGGS